MMQFTIQFFKLQYFTNKKISITMRYFRVGDVNHVVIDIEIQLKKRKISVGISIYFISIYCFKN